MSENSDKTAESSSSDDGVVLLEPIAETEPEQPATIPPARTPNPAEVRQLEAEHTAHLT